MTKRLISIISDWSRIWLCKARQVRRCGVSLMILRSLIASFNLLSSFQQILVRAPSPSVRPIVGWITCLIHPDIAVLFPYVLSVELMRTERYLMNEACNGSMTSNMWYLEWRQAWSCYVVIFSLLRRIILQLLTGSSASPVSSILVWGKENPELFEVV